MPAVITSALFDSPGGAPVGVAAINSRDDLQLGYQVALNSVHTASSYSWSLSFASDSPGSAASPFDGTQSNSALLAPLGSTSRTALFNVDYDGVYLIRLTTDVGVTGVEDTQFVRLRVLTMFGSLKLIAAGERRDENGVIPVDATPEGWTNDQNANVQRLSILLRRLSHTGRVLFVDSNRGRDIANTPDDYDTVISIPGPDTAQPVATGIKLRALAHGDFSTINEAITYAAAAATRGEAALSRAEPYFIVVRKGLYNEDLALQSFIHIIGDDTPINDEMNSLGLSTENVTVRTVNAGGVGTHSYNPGGLATAHECFLFNLNLEGTATTTLPVLRQYGGLLKLYRCTVDQKGDSATQGEALRCVVSNILHIPQLWLEECLINTDATTASRVALRVDAIGSTCVMDRTKVTAAAANAVLTNESLYENCDFYCRDNSLISGLVGYYGYSSSQTFIHSHAVSGTTTPAITVEPFSGAAGSKTGNVAVALSDMHVSHDVSFSTAGAAGTTSLEMSNVRNDQTTGGSHVLFPDAPGDLPDTYYPHLDSETIRYVVDHFDPLLGVAASPTIPVANRLNRENVQEVIDAIQLGAFPIVGAPFCSLDSAYDGLSTLTPPTPGPGLGRRIIATSGAVQVTGGTAPFGVDDESKPGGIQAEGIIDIGGLINGTAGQTIADVGGSEIHLNPNMMGVGPFISLGRAAWTGGVLGGDRGFGGAAIVANYSGSVGTENSYNLHLRTNSGRASGTGKLGNIYVVAGYIQDSTSGDDPGDVHIVAGGTVVNGGTPGDVFIAPGTEAGGTGGVVWICGAGSRTWASVPAVNAYVGNVTGDAFFGTPTGIQSFTFTSGQNIAAAIAVFNATARGFVASEAPAGKITLTNEDNTAGDIVYVGDTTSGTLNTSLGNFLSSDVTFVPGTYGDVVALDVPVADRLRVNGDLEVTGVIIAGGSGYTQVTSNTWTDIVGTIHTVGVVLNATIDTILLLDASLVSYGQNIVIKDEAGLANNIAAPAGQKITISDIGAPTIDGAATLDIITSFGAVKVYKNGNGNWSVF